MQRHPRPMYSRGSLVALVLALGCSDGAGPPGAPASLELDHTALELFSTEIRALHATVRDARGRALNEPVSWASSDAGVARVDAQGRVAGLAEGRATIEARAGGRTAQASVNIRPLLNFLAPLRGQLNSDFFYTNYVDVQAGAGVRDYQCGLKTYDGHTGTDIVLPNFARMDQGVEVLAAAAGTVSAVQDGMPDRNKSWVPGGGLANHVIIDHRDGFRSYYGHMKRNSIRVTAGQQVQAGAVLGLVGSSGTSDMPHLHIEFRQNSAPIEVHSGSCGAGFTHWAAPPDYQDRFRLIDAGTTRSDLSLDLAKDPPMPVDTFSTSDPRLWFWVQLHNLRAGSVSRFRLISPSGLETEVGYQVHSAFYSMSWWWFFVTPGQLSPTGTWRVRYYNDIDQMVERTFVLRPGIAANASTTGPVRPASGIGGGGLNRFH